MNNNYFSAIITHGNLAGCLKRVTNHLIVPSTQFFFYSNKHLTLEEIEHKIEDKRKKIKPEKTIFFIDLVGGSCWLLANRIKKASTDIAVIGGVNVPMLVSYQIHYNQMGWNDLLGKIVDDAKKGIITRL